MRHAQQGCSARARRGGPFEGTRVPARHSRGRTRRIGQSLTREAWSPIRNADVHNGRAGGDSGRGDRTDVSRAGSDTGHHACALSLIPTSSHGSKCSHRATIELVCGRPKPAGGSFVGFRARPRCREFGGMASCAIWWHPGWCSCSIVATSGWPAAGQRGCCEPHQPTRAGAACAGCAAGGPGLGCGWAAPHTVRGLCHAVVRAWQSRQGVFGHAASGAPCPSCSRRCSAGCAGSSVGTQCCRVGDS